MDASILLPAGIVLAVAALSVLAAVSVSRRGSPVVRRVRRAVPTAGPAVPVNIVCPVSAAATRVDIGFEEGTTQPEVVWCERHADGVITCGRECFSVVAAS